MICRTIRSIAARALANVTALALDALASDDDRHAHHGETIAEDEYLTRLARMSRTKGGR